MYAAKSAIPLPLQRVSERSISALSRPSCTPTSYYVRPASSIWEEWQRALCRSESTNRVRTCDSYSANRHTLRTPERASYS